MGPNKQLLSSKWSAISSDYVARSYGLSTLTQTKHILELCYNILLYCDLWHLNSSVAANGVILRIEPYKVLLFSINQ